MQRGFPIGRGVPRRRTPAAPSPRFRRTVTPSRPGDVHLAEMIDRAFLRGWVAGYERAWRTPEGPALDRALALLFTPGATYSTAPFEAPYRGLEAIAGMWAA